MLMFPRQPENNGGWTLNSEFIRELTKILEVHEADGKTSDAIPSWEQIEMVLLAAEEKMNTFLREPLRWFAGEMEETLKRNDHKGGWGDCNTLWLIARLREEVDELEASYGNEQVIKEATDVANFAMMIADKARQGMNAGGWGDCNTLWLGFDG